MGFGRFMKKAVPIGKRIGKLIAKGAKSGVGKAILRDGIGKALTSGRISDSVAASALGTVARMRRGGYARRRRGGGRRRR
jgi:hypothetical protein